MRIKMNKLIIVIFCLQTGFVTAQKAAPISALKLLNVYTIPDGSTYNGTVVGGLSGIDYDKRGNIFYLISDDRSSVNPARFYKARILFNDKGIDTIIFCGVHTMLQSNGSPYPSVEQDPHHVPDPESIRFNADQNQLVWSSEGERDLKDGKILSNPAVTIMDTLGRYISELPLAANLQMSESELGPRKNGVFEGLTFADDFKSLFVSIEEPLYQDGPRADLVPNNSWLRIYKYDLTRQLVASQYAYLPDAVAQPATPENAFKINGLVELLSVGPSDLLTVERSFSTGRIGCTVKVFVTDFRGAEDVSNIYSLRKQPPAQPVRKKLLFNFDTLGVYVDNVEGITFGPALPNGHRTLIFIADNNFSSLEKTQVFLFEVIGD